MTSTESKESHLEPRVLSWTSSCFGLRSSNCALSVCFNDILRCKPLKRFEMKRSLEDSGLSEIQSFNKSKKSLDFGRRRDNGDGASSSGDGSEKPDADVVPEARNARDILRRKLQEKKASSSAEEDKLASWHKDLSTAGVSA